MRSQSTDSPPEPALRAVSNHLMTVSTALRSVDSMTRPVQPTATAVKPA